jgi:hypothetical protein
MEKQDIHLAEQAAESSVVRMLLEERRRLLAELNRVDRILASEGVSAHSSSATAEPSTSTKSGRVRNAITKVEALLQVLQKATKPLSQKELLLGIQELGYVFSSRNPSNTLNPLLYGEHKLNTLTKLPNGFVLTAREKEFTQLKAGTW